MELKEAGRQKTKRQTPGSREWGGGEREWGRGERGERGREREKGGGEVERKSGERGLERKKEIEWGRGE